MKKFFKWSGIILGGLVLLIVLLIIIIFINHDRYAISYTSRGELSENQAAYDVIYYDLDLEIHGADQSISGMVTIKLSSVIDNLAVVELDLIDNFTVDSINQGLEFVHDDDKLLITLEKPLTTGEQIDLEISYAGQPLEAITHRGLVDLCGQRIHQEQIGSVFPARERVAISGSRARIIPRMNRIVQP